MLVSKAPALEPPPCPWSLSTHHIHLACHPATLLTQLLTLIMLPTA